jgi:2-polyprenyl-6-methoxyphenol hydroxylase-like FAD-dependent oxidoreductase
MVLYFGRGQGTEKAVSDAEALVTSIREARRLPEALASYQNKFVYHDEDHRAGLALMMEKPSQGAYYHQIGPEKFMREYEAAIRAAIEAGTFG